MIPPVMMLCDERKLHYDGRRRNDIIVIFK